MNQLTYRIAKASDLENLVRLINQSYRQRVGKSWTSEATIVEGHRISHEQLKVNLRQDNFHLIIAEHLDQLLGCIGLTFAHKTVEIGTFCIASEFQNLGLGKNVLEYAEQYAQDIAPSLNEYVMWVLNVRHELIAYYERRGYEATGKKASYPDEANVGKPLVDLYLIEMTKKV